MGSSAVKIIDDACYGDAASPLSKGNVRRMAADRLRVIFVVAQAFLDMGDVDLPPTGFKKLIEPLPPRAGLEGVSLWIADEVVRMREDSIPGFDLVRPAGVGLGRYSHLLLSVHRTSGYDGFAMVRNPAAFRMESISDPDPVV